MLEIPSYTLVDEGSERLWADFAKMVRDLEWTSTDNTGLICTICYFSLAEQFNVLFFASYYGKSIDMERF